MRTAAHVIKPAQRIGTAVRAIDNLMDNDTLTIMIYHHACIFITIIAIV